MDTRKPSALEAVVLGKCPQCRRGNLFKKPILNPFSLTEMNKHCPHCGLRFEREPGFFYGGMYISYALNTGLFLIAGFTLYVIFENPPFWVYMTTIITIVLSLFPFIFKYSRILFLHLFGGVKFSLEKFQEESTPTT